MTAPGPLRPVADAVRARLRAAQAGGPATPSAIPDDVRAAIAAGNVALVVIYCDRCGVEHRGDYIGADREDRFASARAYLATQGWRISPGLDLCPDEVA